MEIQSATFLAAAAVPIEDQFYKRKAQVFLAGIAGELCRGAGLGFKKGKFDDAHAALRPVKEFVSEFVNTEVEAAA